MKVLRSSYYLSMYLRLILIGGVIIYFVPNIWLKVIFALLFIYMANFQMVSLYYHHRTIIWSELYPIQEKRKEQTFLRWLTQLTFVQTVIFSALFLIWFDLFSLILTLLAGSLFNYLFNFGYVKRKIQQH